MAKHLSTHGEYSFFKDLKLYLHRPIVYFCFGIPLFVPSILLILISTLQEGLNVAFLVMASIFLVVAIVTLSMGVLMAYRDRLGTRQMKRKGMDSLEKSSSDGSSNLQGSQTASTSLSSSSQNSSSQGTNSSSSLKSAMKSNSKSSDGTTSKNNNQLLVTILNNTDKTKLVKMKKKSSGGRSKRGVRFPVQPMPSLQEEDHHVVAATSSKPCSRTGERRTTLHHENELADHNNKTLKSAPLRHPPGAVGGDNIEMLKDYLNDIALGKNVGNVQDLHPLPSSTHPTKSQLGVANSNDEFHRPKSFDENGLARERLGCGPVSTPLTSRELATPTSPRKDFPRLVTVSHERTGLY